MKILLISARNFGDSVIITELIKNIPKNYKIDILTRKEFIPIFKQLVNINNIYTANFPMGTIKNFNLQEAKKLLTVIKNIRKNDYDFVLNNVGDFRENLLGFLISKNNVSVKWSNKHPFVNLIRPGLSFLVKRFIEIPDSLLNIYDIQKFITFEIFDEVKENNMSIHQDKEQKYIAIHPIASQRTKFWKYENWVKLIQKIQINEKIIVFCAPNEVDEIEKNFTLVREKIEIVAKDLDYFFNTLKKVKLFIGLDSFSIHAAYMMNVPHLIMLNGANDSRVWAPPNTKVISGGYNCQYFPCYNKPKCMKKDFEYVCMNSISVEEVYSVIKGYL